MNRFAKGKKLLLHPRTRAINKDLATLNLNSNVYLTERLVLINHRYLAEIEGTLPDDVNVRLKELDEAKDRLLQKLITENSDLE